MPPTKLKALYGLLHHLQFEDHLLEAIFYNACQRESKCIPLGISNIIQESLERALHVMRCEYFFLFDRLGMSEPYTIHEDRRALKRLIRKIERMIKEAEG